MIRVKDPAGFGDWVIIDFFFWFGWEEGRSRLEDVLVRGALGPRIDLVVVEASAFPIFMEGEEKLWRLLLLKP